jgi:release factor glutamine methyltransferase
MKIKDYRTFFTSNLASTYDALEAESFFYLILEHQMKLTRVDLALKPDLELTDLDLSQWDYYLKQLQLEVPIQYLLGTTNFYGLDFKVNPNVLIPRPETEELVQWIIDWVDKEHKNNNVKILDIGTGSGCIAIALAKNLPNAQVFALDVSDKALAVAQENAKEQGVNVVFIQKNILEARDLEYEFDIIVSNPPYVRNLEKQEIKKNVLDNEPHLALFVEDDDSLLFYRKIADLAKTNSAKGIQLFFEINQYLGRETVDLLLHKGFQEVEIRKDFYQNDRMIKARVIGTDS